ncbi:MAG: hypothetical protein RL742_709 [Bacteroidota bacterium]
MIQRLFFLLLLGLLSADIGAQGELNCTVRVSTPQLQNVDRKVFDNLEVSLRDFLNNTKWTKDNFEPDERIRCNFILTIKTEIDNTTFDAELAVQSVRPVYGSGYDTPMLSHLDKEFIFSYDLNQPIEFLPDVADNQNLAAVFAFYAYIILGMDYDSFSPFGGDQHFLTAQQIVTNIQNSNNKSSGWRPADGGKNRNRYWVVENLLNPRIKPFRAAMYNYHRKGLDLFSTDMEKGKAAILQCLEEVDKVSTAYINSMIVQMFANSKRDEIVEMWKVGSKPQKDRIFQIMVKIDPANTQRYKEMGV